MTLNSLPKFIYGIYCNPLAHYPSLTIAIISTPTITISLGISPHPLLCCTTSRSGGAIRENVCVMARLARAPVGRI